MMQPFSSVNPQPTGTLSKKQICDYAECLKEFLATEECTKNLSEEKLLELRDELKIWEDRAEFAKKISLHEITRYDGNL